MTDYSPRPSSPPSRRPSGRAIPSPGPVTVLAHTEGATGLVEGTVRRVVTMSRDAGAGEIVVTMSRDAGAGEISDHVQRLAFVDPDGQVFIEITGRRRITDPDEVDALDWLTDAEREQVREAVSRAAAALAEAAGGRG